MVLAIRDSRSSTNVRNTVYRSTNDGALFLHICTESALRVVFIFRANKIGPLCIVLRNSLAVFCVKTPKFMK